MTETRWVDDLCPLRGEDVAWSGGESPKHKLRSTGTALDRTNIVAFTQERARTSVKIETKIVTVDVEGLLSVLVRRTGVPLWFGVAIPTRRVFPADLPLEVVAFNPTPRKARSDMPSPTRCVCCVHCPLGGGDEDSGSLVFGAGIR